MPRKSKYSLKISFVSLHVIGLK